MASSAGLVEWLKEQKLDAATQVLVGSGFASCSDLATAFTNCDAKTIRKELGLAGLEGLKIATDLRTALDSLDESGFRLRDALRGMSIHDQQQLLSEVNGKPSPQITASTNVDQHAAATAQKIKREVALSSSLETQQGMFGSALSSPFPMIIVNTVEGQRARIFEFQIKFIASTSTDAAATAILRDEAGVPHVMMQASGGGKSRLMYELPRLSSSPVVVVFAYFAEPNRGAMRPEWTAWCASLTSTVSENQARAIFILVAHVKWAVRVLRSMKDAKYTPDVVLRALRNRDGTKGISQEYELLCENNKCSVVTALQCKDHAESALRQLTDSAQIVFALDEVQTLAGFNLGAFQGSSERAQDALYGIAAAAVATTWTSVLLGTTFSLQDTLAGVSPLSNSTPISPSTVLDKQRMWTVLQSYFDCLPDLPAEQEQEQQQEDVRLTQQAAKLLAMLEGRPRFFIKFALEALETELRKTRPSDTNGVLVALVSACQSAVEVGRRTLTKILRNFQHRCELSRKLVTTLCSGLLFQSKTLELRLGPTEKTCVEAGILALPPSQVSSNGMVRLDPRAEPLLVLALAEVEVNIPMENFVENMLLAMPSNLWQAIKGIAAEHAWVAFLLRAVKNKSPTVLEVFQNASQLPLPQWLGSYVLTATQGREYNKADLFSVSRQHLNTVFYACHQNAGTDILLWATKKPPPESSKRLKTQLAKRPQHIPLLLQSKTGEGSLLEAIRTTLPFRQFLGKSGNKLAGRDGFVTFAQDHACELRHAIRIVASNRELTRSAKTAIQTANTHVASKKSPLVVILSSAAVTGSIIQLHRVEYAAPRQCLPQPQDECK